MIRGQGTRLFVFGYTAGMNEREQPQTMYDAIARLDAALRQFGIILVTALHIPALLDWLTPRVERLPGSKYLNR